MNFSKFQKRKSYTFVSFLCGAVWGYCSARFADVRLNWRHSKIVVLAYTPHTQRPTAGSNEQQFNPCRQRLYGCIVRWKLSQCHEGHGRTVASDLQPRDRGTVYIGGSPTPTSRWGLHGTLVIRSMVRIVAAERHVFGTGTK